MWHMVGLMIAYVPIHLGAHYQSYIGIKLLWFSLLVQRRDAASGLLHLFAVLSKDKNMVEDENTIFQYQHKSWEKL